MRVSNLAWILVSVRASEAERNLHRSLFDAKNYNPRVIQDGWRKANRGDYDNIGAFAADKCAGYSPPDETGSVQPGSLLVTESFATMQPYKNNATLDQEFKCYDGETVQLRLDLDRGFNTEARYDNLHVWFKYYYRKVSGSIDDLPNELKQEDWFDTRSTFVRMLFTSDSSVVLSGFKFDIMCAAFSQTRTVPTAESTLSNTIITNRGSNNVPFTKKVSCQLSSERVQYRLMRELISSTEASHFEELVGKKIMFMYGNLSNAKRSLDASNGDWISTDAQELFVMYLSDSSSTDYSSGSGSGESPPDIDYIYFTEPEGEFSHLRSLPLNTAGPDFVTFSIEVKCEPMCEFLVFA